MHIVLIAHYYPPINSSGAKRAESLSKYFISFGHDVTVITTCKRRSDGDFTETVPKGVKIVELDWSGLERPSVNSGVTFESMYSGKPSWRRRLKDWVMGVFGQIPDPRLPFALAFLMPWLAQSAKNSIRHADIVIGTTPPWPMILAAIFCKLRFGTTCILDYRDHFSECHEMPGSRFAKLVEKIIDKKLISFSDQVICVSDPMSGYYKKLGENVETILNGYDHELLIEARTKTNIINDDFVRIRYMGIVSPGRVPYGLLRALVIIKERRFDLFKKLRIEFYGNASILNNVLKKSYCEVEGAFFFYGPISYVDSLKKIIEADYLLFSETSSMKTISAQGILTTKLFEYIGAGRPIIGHISSDTLAGQLLIKSGGRHIIGESPEIFISAMLNESFYMRYEDYFSPISESLSRKSQASKYARILEKYVLQNKDIEI